MWDPLSLRESNCKLTSLWGLGRGANARPLLAGLRKRGRTRRVKPRGWVSSSAAAGRSQSSQALGLPSMRFDKILTPAPLSGFWKTSPTRGAFSETRVRSPASPARGPAGSRQLWRRLPWSGAQKEPALLQAAGPRVTCSSPLPGGVGDACVVLAHRVWPFSAGRS